MDPFPALYEAFLRAAEADSGLRKESFLEQARHHIAEGKLRASGRPFSVTWTRRLYTTGIPRENKTESPDRVEIPPLAMADHVKANELARRPGSPARMRDRPAAAADHGGRHADASSNKTRSLGVTTRTRSQTSDR
jgi:hypothetical protein